jgi:hypothetical protein
VTYNEATNVCGDESLFINMLYVNSSRIGMLISSVTFVKHRYLLTLKCSAYFHICYLKVKMM